MNVGLLAGLPKIPVAFRGISVDPTGATSLGDQAGFLTTNTNIGFQAGLNTRLQASGIASGSSAGRWNTMIGYQAGLNVTSGDSNVSIGYQAGPIGAVNQGVYVGYQAGLLDNSGVFGNNTFVGYKAGSTNTTGA
jgi:hypothetical protein